MTDAEGVAFSFSNDQMRKRLAKTFFRWSAFAVIAAVLAVVFSDALWAAWEKVRDEPIETSWHLALAMILFVAAVPVSGVLWCLVLRKMGAGQVPYWHGAMAHVVSWLLKYIPGQIGSFAYKLYWGRNRRIRSSLIAASFFYENLFLQIASLAPGLVILLVWGGANSVGTRYIFAISAAVAVLAIVIISAKPASNFLFRLMQKTKEFEPSNISLLPASTCFQLAILFTLPRLLNGAGFVFIVANLASVDAMDWAPLAAAYAVAGAIGILAIFVPSGLGVREAALAVLIAPTVGAEVAIVAALLARLLSMFADLLLLAITTTSGLINLKAHR